MLEKLKKQELSIFEIIGMTFSIFKENVHSFLSIAFIIGAPLSFIVTYISSKVEAVTMNVNLMNLVNNVNELESFIKSGNFKNLLLCDTAWVILEGLFYPLIILAVAHMTKEILEGRKADPMKSMLASFEKGHILIPAAIIYEIIVYMGLMLFVIPGIIFTVWLYFYKYAIILDDEKVIGSLSFSRELAKNNFGKIALSLLALFILENAIGNLVQSIFISSNSTFVMEFITRCILTGIDTFFWSAAALLYLNIKYMKYKN